MDRARAETPILSPTGVEMDPLAVPYLRPIKDVWGVKQEVDTEGWDPNMNRFSAEGLELP